MLSVYAGIALGSLHLRSFYTTATLLVLLFSPCPYFCFLSPASRLEFTLVGVSNIFESEFHFSLLRCIFVHSYLRHLPPLQLTSAMTPIFLSPTLLNLNFTLLQWESKRVKGFNLSFCGIFFMTTSLLPYVYAGICISVHTYVCCVCAPNDACACVRVGRQDSCHACKFWGPRGLPSHTHRCRG